MVLGWVKTWNAADQITDVAPIDIVYNEARLQYLDYTHPTHYSEMAIFSKKLSFIFFSKLSTIFCLKQI